MLTNLKNSNTENYTQNNKQLRQTLLQLIVKGRLPHCFVLQGQASENQLDFALEVAAALLCSENGCGSCKDCENVLSNSHQDVQVIEKDLDKTEFTIDKIRAMKMDTFIAPGSAAYKVYILKDSHLLNIQAQNALLKTLEEPLEDTFFILTCESASLLLETIRSRAVIFDLDQKTKSSEMLNELQENEKIYLEELSEFSAQLQEFLLQNDKYILNLVEQLVMTALLKNKSGVLQQVAKLFQCKDKQEIKQVALLAQKLLSLGVRYKTSKSFIASLPKSFMQVVDQVQLEKIIKTYEKFSEIIETLPIHLNTSIAQIYFASQLTI